MTPRLLQAYNSIKTCGDVSPDALMARLDITRANANQILSRLRRLGKIRRSDLGRKFSSDPRYEVTDV